MAQTLEAVFYQGNAEMIDHTPGSAIAAGTIINDSGLVKVAHLDIPANKLGAMSISGIYKVKKAVSGGVTFTAGDEIEWNNTTKLAVAATAGTFNLGVATEAAADGDDHVKVKINQLALQ